MSSQNVIRSVNPATEEVLHTYEMHSPEEIEQAIPDLGTEAPGGMDAGEDY